MKSSYAIMLCLLCAGSATYAQTTAPLTLTKTIPLPSVTGKFDHFAFDVAGSRLFAAATGNHTVEVIDTASGKVTESITGLGKPHGLAWVAATGSLYVSDRSLAELRVYKGSPLALAGKIKLSDDADDMVFDDAHHLLFVGHGGKDAANPAKVAVVDTDHFTLVANLDVATHPEALDIDPQGRRVFVNIADSDEIAVIDTTTKAITARWKLTKAKENVPLAFDGGKNLLYVACRKPGTMIALDAKTGAELAGLPAAAGADDLFYDSGLRRVYVISGSGEVDAYQAGEGNTVSNLGALKTAPGAKTALFVPSQHLLYVGIPGTTDHPAEIRAYSADAGGASK